MTPLLPKLYPLILLLLGLLFFVPFLGYSPLFDGAELRHAEVAREMLATQTFRYAQINFLPDYTTPPLLPWLQALSMRVFGVADNAELAARLPSALMGIITVLTLFFIGRQKHDARFGFLWSLSYVGSVTPMVLAKSAMPATTGYFFTFLGVLFFIEAVSNRFHHRKRKLVWASLFFGLGMLTIDGLIPGFLFIALMLINYWREVHKSIPARVSHTALVLSFPVIGTVARLTLTPGPDWNRAMSTVSSDNPFAQLYLLAGGVAGIWLIIILASRYWSAQKPASADEPELLFRRWISIATRSSLILLIYSPSGTLLLWFFLSYLATYHIHQVLRGERSWDNLNTYLVLSGGLLIGLLMLGVPLLGMNPDWLARQTSDPFWSGMVQSPVAWNGWEWLIGVVLMLATTTFALLLRRHTVQAVLGLYGSTAVCTLTFLAVVGPKIEQYAQGPLIDFCEAKWNQPVYVQPSFSSYAHLFYTRKKPPVRPESRNINWLANGPVDKQTFIITTATDASLYRYNPSLELLSEEYGYVFFTRKQYR